MATWKKKDEDGKTHFEFLCSSCHEQKRKLLERQQWSLVREGEPASCNDCALQCALTRLELWGAEDRIRYRICDECPALGKCALKGRYYC